MPVPDRTIAPPTSQGLVSTCEIARKPGNLFSTPALNLCRTRPCLWCDWLGCRHTWPLLPRDTAGARAHTFWGAKWTWRAPFFVVRVVSVYFDGAVDLADECVACHKANGACARTHATAVSALRNEVVAQTHCAFTPCKLVASRKQCAESNSSPRQPPQAATTRVLPVQKPSRKPHPSGRIMRKGKQPPPRFLPQRGDD